MLDLIIKGAQIVDGTGAAAYNADVGVQDGVVTQIGLLSEPAKRIVNADGALLTPGFIDIHTHYDGQATWDDVLRPSIDHGVSSVVLGNCGVGFAPVVAGGQDRLLQLMEGVEEIPGAALAEGIRWGWHSFEQYMQTLERTPRSLNVMNLVPHDCVRLAVMGERAAHGEMATNADIQAMKQLLHQALLAGAAGFSTGRTANHRTTLGKPTPAANAASSELLEMAGVLRQLPYRVIHAVSDFQCTEGNPAEQRNRFDKEFQLLEAIAIASGRPLALSWLERINAPLQADWLGEAAADAQQRGAQIRLQTSCRPIGVLNGLGSTFHPLMAFPSYQSIAHLPVAERALAMRKPGFKETMLSEPLRKLAHDGSAVPPIVDQLMANFDQTAKLMFALADGQTQSVPNYMPDPMTSFGVQALRTGVSAISVVYDYLSSGQGDRLIYFPIFNYLTGSPKTLQRMLAHPQALLSLSDAGAHVGSICDASLPTTLLTHWVGQSMAIEQAVHLLTLRNAQHIGMKNRGTIAVGMVADLNLIDLPNLRNEMPTLVHDLPAGGKRFVQGASGYIASFVAGQTVMERGQITDARPGKWLAAQR
jgi:N-acyl-D-aspartate/D-glutamate deacylase